MIMEHMHLLERRQDRSFILIAQWQLIFDPQTNLKCRVFGARQGLTDRGWQRFTRGKNTLNQTFRHAHLQDLQKTGQKIVFLSSRFGQEEIVFHPNFV